MVPTLVDPKKRVRQASQECVAILAAFMGPTKAAPLIRSIELLESHFERGAGVLNAVQARLSRRQLPRITADGLVEYSLQIPRSALRYNTSSRGRSGSPLRNKKYGADIEWILAGKTCDGVTRACNPENQSRDPGIHFKSQSRDLKLIGISGLKIVNFGQI